MSNLSLEGFQKHTPNRGAKTISITINKCAGITLNSFMVKVLYLDRFKTANLYYNRTTFTVAVEFLKDDSGDYKSDKHKGSLVIAGKTFCGPPNNISFPAKTEYLGTSDGDSVVYFKII
jgi:hypothetical protein